MTNGSQYTPAAPKRNTALEFWRFVFTVFIILFHYDQFCMGDSRTSFFVNGYLGVEFFFVLSGFFLAKRSDSLREKNLSPGQISIDCIKGKSLYLYYPLVAAVLLTALLSIFWDHVAFSNILYQLSNLEFEFLFLTLAGFAKENVWISTAWYLSGLIFGSYVISYLYSKYRSQFVFVIAPIIVLFVYSGMAYTKGNLNSIMDRDFIFSYGMERALAGISLGVVTWWVYEKLENFRFSKLQIVLMNLFELYCVYRIATILIRQTDNLDAFKALIYFPLLICFSFSGKTVLSKLISNPVSMFLGTITNVMFFIHYLVLYRIRISMPGESLRKEWADYALAFGILIGTSMLVQLLIWLYKRFLGKRVVRLFGFAKAAA